MRGRGIDHLVVTSIAGADRSKGRLRAGPLTLPCALGGAGVTRGKREGDHATPAGSWRLLYGFYRPETALARPAALPMRPMRANEGWCDDPASALYNRLVVTPFRRSHEALWRRDGLYDIVIVLDYNIFPRRQGRGSAIFLHCAREEIGRDGFAPTEGCVALAYRDLRRLLPRLSSRTILTIR